MRRLLIGFILLFALTVQAQERRIEDWMVWLYLPEEGTLLFRGFYAEQDDNVEFIPVTFERRLQVIELARNLPNSVLVSDDASTIAYVVSTSSAFSESATASSFAKIVLTEILSQGVLEHEVRTFDSTTVSMAFHTTETIQELGHALYHEQQRLPALASQHPDRERTLAYAYRDISEEWRIEVFDFNADRVLNQFDMTIIPELEAERIIVHRYQDDAILFSAITGDTQTLYEWSLANSSTSEQPDTVLSTETTDYAVSTNESLATEGNSLLYHRNPTASARELFEGEAGQSLNRPRFVLGGEAFAFKLDDSISVIDRDGNSLISVIPAANLTQLMSTPTGFVYVLETEAFSEVNYVHMLDDDFYAERFVVWGSYEGATPVQAIYVHSAVE